MKEKKIYIYTIGCQMNVYDSEQIVNLVHPINYVPTSVPEDADLIIVNTCTIRAKAEEKAFSFLGRVSGLKKQNPRLIIGIGGCVAQQEGERILSRAPYVDLVFGTRAIGRIPAHINTIEKKRQPVVDVDMAVSIEDELYPVTCPATDSDVSKFVTIMRGCENYCTYCVVPYVRGREVSRAPGKIVEEVEKLVMAGAREITLLGQNVNSYGTKEGLCSFPDLLARINGVPGLQRIRFATSHPKDLSDDLIGAIAGLDKVVNHIHLPVQSGSDAMLKKMNRHYTKYDYLDKVRKLRQAVQDVEITTDMIVGFPGETQADFIETISLMETIQFDGVFAFKYSDRPSTPARAFSPKIPEQEKKDRLQHLLDLQESITRKKHEAALGQIKDILVEGHSKHSAKQGGRVQWTGRTYGVTIVNFDAGETDSPQTKDLIGRMVKVRIDKALSHSLWGRMMEAVTGG